MSQYAVESHGTPVGESTKPTRYHLEGRSEVTMKVQVLQEKAPNGGQGEQRTTERRSKRRRVPG